MDCLIWTTQKRRNTQDWRMFALGRLASVLALLTQCQPRRSPRCSQTTALTLTHAVFCSLRA